MSVKTYLEKPYPIRGNIILTTPKEITTEIIETINPKKTPVFDFVMGKILKHLQRKVIVKLKHCSE